MRNWQSPAIINQHLIIEYPTLTIKINRPTNYCLATLEPPNHHQPLSTIIESDLITSCFFVATFWCYLLIINIRKKRAIIIVNHHELSPWSTVTQPPLSTISTTQSTLSHRTPPVSSPLLSHARQARHPATPSRPSRSPKFTKPPLEAPTAIFCLPRLRLPTVPRAGNSWFRFSSWNSWLNGWFIMVYSGLFMMFKWWLATSFNDL